MKRGGYLKRIGSSPLQKAIAKLDTAVSKMVRERDRGLGCITCSRNAGQFDCGHFQWRGKMSTRFHPYNLAAQCLACNRFEGGRTYEFGLAIDKRWGKGMAKRIYSESRKMKQWDVRELEQLAGAAKLGANAYNQLYDELS